MVSLPTAPFANDEEGQTRTLSTNLPPRTLGTDHSNFVITSSVFSTESRTSARLHTSPNLPVTGVGAQPTISDDYFNLKRRFPPYYAKALGVLYYRYPGRCQTVT